MVALRCDWCGRFCSVKDDHVTSIPADSDSYWDPPDTEIDILCPKCSEENKKTPEKK